MRALPGIRKFLMSITVSGRCPPENRGDVHD